MFTCFEGSYKDEASLVAYGVKFETINFTSFNNEELVTCVAFFDYELTLQDVDYLETIYEFEFLKLVKSV